MNQRWQKMLYAVCWVGRQYSQCIICLQCNQMYIFFNITLWKLAAYFKIKSRSNSWVTWNIDWKPIKQWISRGTQLSQKIVELPSNRCHLRKGNHSEEGNSTGYHNHNVPKNLFWNFNFKKISLWETMNVLTHVPIKCILKENRIKYLLLPLVN